MVFLRDAFVCDKVQPTGEIHPCCVLFPLIFIKLYSNLRQTQVPDLLHSFISWKHGQFFLMSHRPNGRTWNEIFFPKVSSTKSSVTQKCQGEGKLTGSSVNVSREFQIKPRNITVKNYNLGIDINVDSTIFTDSGIREDYDSQRTVQQTMIQMKHS